MGSSKNITTLSQNLFESKATFVLQTVPDRPRVEAFLNDFLDLAFPGMLRKSYVDARALRTCLELHLDALCDFAQVLGMDEPVRDRLREIYCAKIMILSAAIKKDATALFDGDPAASSIEEIFLCYPGLYAVAAHRLAHFFCEQQVQFLPRVISEIAHEKTGIDIHPGATIGESFFIDHGTGVVIGATAIIGNHVKIYQGVTLGALSVDKSMASLKRHPTIEDNCVIYSQATILGGDTIIGANSVIGGNVWITKSVPSNSLVYHKSEVRLGRVDSSHELFTTEEELSYEI